MDYKNMLYEQRHQAGMSCLRYNMSFSNRNNIFKHYRNCWFQNPIYDKRNKIDLTCRRRYITAQRQTITKGWVKIYKQFWYDFWHVVKYTVDKTERMLLGDLKGTENKIRGITLDTTKKSVLKKKIGEIN